MAEILDESIVSRLYKDPETGIIIIEDILGRFHLLSNKALDE